MKLLVFSDIHGDRAALERLMETEADYYFAAGDLVNWAKGFEHVGPIHAAARGKGLRDSGESRIRARRGGFLCGVWI